MSASNAKMTAASRSRVSDIDLTLAKNPANSIVLLGDSITAAEIHDIGSIGQTAGTFAKGIFGRTNALLYQRFNVVNYAGISGETPAQILARVVNDVISYNPKYVWIQSSGNGIAAGSTAAGDWDKIKRTIDTCVSAGIIPVVTTILTRGNGVIANTATGAAIADTAVNAWTQAELDVYNTINQSIRDYSASSGGFILIDWAGAFLDYSTYAYSYSGLAKSLHTLDGTHPNDIGAGILADFTFSVLDTLIPQRLDALSVNTDATLLIGDKNNCVENGLMVGILGTHGTNSTGVVADEWRGTAPSGAIAGVSSKVARTDGYPGEWQRCELSGATALTDYFRYDQAAARAIADLGWAAGDKVQFEAEVKTSAIVGELTVLMLNVVFTATVDEGYQANYTDVNNDVTNIAFSSGALLKSRVMTIPAGATAILPTLVMATSIGGTATVDWTRVRCLKVG